MWCDVLFGSDLRQYNNSEWYYMKYTFHHGFFLSDQYGLICCVAVLLTDESKWKISCMKIPFTVLPLAANALLLVASFRLVSLIVIFNAIVIAGLHNVLASGQKSRFYTHQSVSG